MTSATDGHKGFRFSPLNVWTAARGIAVETMTGTLAVTHTNPTRAYFRRGICLYWLGFHEEAIVTFRKILRLNWRDERALLWIEKAKRAHSQEIERLVAASRQGMLSYQPVVDWIP